MSTNIHILIIDDNPRDRALVMREIRREFQNAQMQEIIDQAALTQALEEDSYDLIITDYHLRWTDGLKVLQSAREYRPDCPIIMFTGTGTEEVAVEAMKKGLNDYVLKSPKHYVRLPSAIRAVLENARRHQEMTDRIHLLTRTVEQSQSIIMVTDTQGNLEYVNPKFTQVTDYTIDEIVGQTLQILKPDETEQDYQELWRTICEGGTWQGEFHNRKKDGTLYWEASTIVPIKDNSEKTTHFLAVGEDVTQRKQEEEERLQLERQVYEQATQLRLILETVPEGVILLDALGTVVSTNKVGMRELDILAGAQQGDTITHLGDRTLSDLLTSPTSKGLWHEVTADDQIFEIIAQPVVNGAEPENWVMVINDVTQARQIRNQLHQQERLSAVGQLATGIGHDFNNIMAVILLYAQISLHSNNLDEETKTRLKTIQEQSHHASNLIRQILDFSRQSVLEQRSINLIDLVNEQAKLLRRTLPENIEVNVIYCPEQGYVVNADSTRMQQMITNLALNARDAMPDGGVLSIELERTQVKPYDRRPIVEMEAGTWIKLIIKDTGSGIPPEIIPHVFEPFYTTKNRGDGTGLGLAQAHGIVGQHGGHIHVNSTPGEGATFAVYLPAWSHTPSEVDKTVFDTLPQGNGELILVVEDSEVLRLTLVESLQKLSYQVVATANGNEALAVMQARSDEISLILSDVVMPQMGGLPLARAIRQQGWQTPLILLSGHPLEPEQKSRAQDEGEISYWLSKPVSLEDLASVLTEVISKSRSIVRA